MCVIILDYEKKFAVKLWKFSRLLLYRLPTLGKENIIIKVFSCVSHFHFVINASHTKVGFCIINGATFVSLQKK